MQKTKNNVRNATKGIFFGISVDNLIPKNDGTIIKSIKLKKDRTVWNCQKEVQSAANFTNES